MEVAPRPGMLATPVKRPGGCGKTVQDRVYENGRGAASRAVPSTIEINRFVTGGERSSVPFLACECGSIVSETLCLLSSALDMR
jgi:hypothetical protein